MAYAFFDFDRTVIHGDAGPRFGWWLWRRRRAGLKQRHGRSVAAARRTAMVVKTLPFVMGMLAQTALYKVRARRRSSIVRSAYKGLRGVPVAPLDERIEAFVEDHVRPLVYPDIVREMEDHIAAGRQPVIVTTGMERLVERCLPLLPGGVELIGCRLEEKRGRLTGRVVSGPLYGQDKANIILAYCRATGVDPGDCWAYTDHDSDRQMLEAVGHGACVNPGARLAKAAKARGWRIMRLDDPRLATA